MAETHTQRTLKRIKDQLFIVAKAEHWNPYVPRPGSYTCPKCGNLVNAGIRQDLFNFIDIIYLDPSRGIVAVQSGAVTDHQKHLKKIHELPAAVMWLVCGGKIEMWSWGKYVVKRGGKAKRWKAKIDIVTLEDFDSQMVAEAKRVQQELALREEEEPF